MPVQAIPVVSDDRVYLCRFFLAMAVICVDVSLQIPILLLRPKLDDFGIPNLHLPLNSLRILPEMPTCT